MWKWIAAAVVVTAGVVLVAVRSRAPSSSSPSTGTARGWSKETTKSSDGLVSETVTIYVDAHGRTWKFFSMDNVGNSTFIRTDGVRIIIPMTATQAQSAAQMDAAA